MSVGGRSVSIFTEIQEIKINLDGNGGVISTGVGNSFYTVSDYGSIVGWYITGNPSGSITVDVWKKFQAIPSGAGDSICGGEKPSLVASQLNSDTDLTSWNIYLVPGDVLGINIESVSGITNCVITLKVSKP